MTTQRASGLAFFPSRTRSSPERPGMRRSVMTRSKSDAESIASPSVPSRASSSLYPSSPRTVQRKERIGPSSSTIRIFFDIERSPRVRKKDGEYGPGGFLPIRQIDLPVHSFHGFFRVGQPQSRTIRLGGMEGSEQAGHLGLGDAGAAVLDPDLDPAVIGSHGDPEAPPVPHRLDRVADPVGKHPAKLLRIRQNDRSFPRIELNLALPSVDLPRHRLVNQDADVYRLDRVRLLP